MVTAIEREVGTKLVRRTIDRSNPTEVGRAFDRRLAAALRKSRRQIPQPEL
jgi:DNA-binding transcriptional LysR family regulator